MNNNQHGHRKRLKEKYLKSGLSGFHDYEIVELLLMYAIPRRDVKPVAKKLLKEFGDLFHLLNASVERLTAVQGVGESAAIIIKLVRDASINAMGTGLKKQEYINSASEVASLCRMRVAGKSDELFEIICLTGSNRLIEIVTISEGVPDKVVVFPRKVLEIAIKHSASKIILVHNHPSGNPEPSQEDLVITRKIERAGNTLNITVFDHLIFGADCYYSLAEDKIIY